LPALPVAVGESYNVVMRRLGWVVAVLVLAGSCAHGRKESRHHDWYFPGVGSREDLRIVRSEYAVEDCEFIEQVTGDARSVKRARKEAMERAFRLGADTVLIIEQLTEDDGASAHVIGNSVIVNRHGRVSYIVDAYYCGADEDSDSERYANDDEADDVSADGCSKDTDCKGDRVCDNRVCRDPTP
jgi:hypothetical protein